MEWEPCTGVRDGGEGGAKIPNIGEFRGGTAADVAIGRDRDTEGGDTTQKRNLERIVSHISQHTWRLQDCTVLHNRSTPSGYPVGITTTSA